MTKRALFAVLVVALLLPAASEAAFPGANGKIAFVRAGDIWTMNPDGTGQVNLTNTPQAEADPAWSPDGSRIAFAKQTGPGFTTQVFVMSADGTGVTPVTTSSPGGADPSWSPDGNRLAFSESRGFISTINVDGTDETIIADAEDGDPEWSPDGTKVAYHEGQRCGGSGSSIYTGPADPPLGDQPAGFEVTPCEGFEHSRHYYPNWSPDGQRIVYVFDLWDSTAQSLQTIRPDRTDRQTVTTFASGFPASKPAWSPDGSKFVFAHRATQGSLQRVKTINANGTNFVDLAEGHSPDWQPLPPNSYPRPQGAGPARFALVPAYAPCDTPNATHGGALAEPSCNPPVRISEHVTLPTPDANGGTISFGFQGHLRVRPIIGDRESPTDEADVSIEVSGSDLRCSATNPPATCGAANNALDGYPPLNDYTGELDAVFFLRITDKNSTFATNPGRAATVEDMDLHFTVPCVGTSGTGQGGICSTSTTVEALLPGAIVEGRRSIWELDRVHVRDGGADGDAATSGNRVLLRPGVFVP